MFKSFSSFNFLQAANDMPSSWNKTELETLFSSVSCESNKIIIASVLTDHWPLWLLDSTPQWMDLCWLPTPELIGARALELSRLRLWLGPSVNIPPTLMFKHCQDINTRVVTSDTPSSTWSEQSQDGLRRGQCKRDLLCWTENYIQHQNSTYICSFHCCFDIPWNLKDPLFNYSDQDTGQGSLCAVKRIWGYII